MSRQASSASPLAARCRGAAANVAIVVGTRILLTAYEALSGDEISPTDVQFLRAALLLGVVLWLLSLAVSALVKHRVNIVGEVWSALRDLAVEREWAQFARVAIGAASFPIALGVAGLAYWREGVSFATGVAVFCATWCAVIIWVLLVTFIADEPGHRIPKDRPLMRRVVGRGALPLSVATSLFFAAAAASAFQPGAVAGLIYAVGLALCGVLFLTLVLFGWPQRLLIRQLRRKPTRRRAASKRERTSIPSDRPPVD